MLRIIEMAKISIKSLKCFGVRFSGHGLKMMPENPTYDKTFQEALKEANDWELRADTIGGRAEIVTCPELLEAEINGI